jgi:hypothetical protein
VKQEEWNDLSGGIILRMELWRDKLAGMVHVLTGMQPPPPEEIDKIVDTEPELHYLNGKLIELGNRAARLYGLRSGQAMLEWVDACLAHLKVLSEKSLDVKYESVAHEYVVKVEGWYEDLYQGENIA